MSQPQHLRIHFIDSSDDGASHEATVRFSSPHNEGSDGTTTPLASSGTRQPYGAESRQEGWWSALVYRGAKAMTGLLLGPAPTIEREPFQGSPQCTPGLSRGRSAPNSSSSSSNIWAFGHSQEHTSHEESETASDPPSDSILLPGAAAEDEYDQVNLDLKETVLMFLETGSNVFMNIILATLKAGTELVNGDIFEMVGRSPTLVKVFLDSGRVDTDDPEVQSVVQVRLNEVLRGDPYKGDVLTSDMLDYIRCLCSVKTSRITYWQMVLMLYSGFDYIEVLFDYPYLLENVEQPGFWMLLLLRILHHLSILTSWLGVLVLLFFNATVVWLVVSWFRSFDAHNNGYWTIACYVAGYIVSLVSTMRADEHRIKQYDSQIWDYPNSNLKLVPVVPVYEILLSYTALRYELLQGKAQYFILRYDLRNGILLQQVIHGFFYDAPQIILQTFLYRYYDGALQGTQLVVSYWTVFGACCMLAAMSIFAFYRIVVFSQSCSSFGFAMQSKKASDTHERLSSRRVLPSDIATKVLIFFTMYFLVCISVTLFVALLKTSSCDGQYLVFLSIYVGVTAVTIIVYVLLLVYIPLSRLMGLGCIPVLIMEIAYLILLRTELDDSDCIMFVRGVRGWIIPGVVFFGLMCISLTVWMAMVLCELIKGSRIEQRSIDRCLFALS